MELKNSLTFVRVMASVHEYLNMLKKQRGENWEQNFKEIKKSSERKFKIQEGQTAF